VYELQNLSALKCFIQDNVQPGEAYLCTLNGDFLSPSLLSSLDLGAAAVSAMNAIPVTHACLGNHEFDHSIEILGQRLGELDAEVVNTNVFACPEGEEHVTKDATRRALANAVPYPEASAPEGLEKSAGAFLDALPRSSVVDVGGVRIGLLGLCTTSTPLSSARKPKGVVFAECVPLAKAAAKALLPNVDAVVALTHQTLPEDTRLAEEVPELAAILGGHEHTPFAGRMGHGANAAARIAQHRTASSKASSASRAAHECVNEESGTLCVKAGMDAENVVVVTVDVPASSARGSDRGGACDADAAAAALDAKAAAEARAAAVADAARAHHDEFGRGGLWQTRAESETLPEEFSKMGKGAEDSESCAFDAEGDECGAAANNVVPAYVDLSPGKKKGDAEKGDAGDFGRDAAVVEEEAVDAALHAGAATPRDPTAPSVAPGAELGAEVAVTRPGSRVRVSARMYSLRGYRTDPEIDADVWARSEVLRGLNQHTLSLHEHAARLGIGPLSSRDSRCGQCSLGTLFATILRDECRADVCLYNSGGIRGNAEYGLGPLTYGDLVAEVPFENNVVTLEMSGAELARAVAFSEAEQIRKSREGGSWGGYLQWDEGVAVARRPRREKDATSDDPFDFELLTVRGKAVDAARTYRVVTWAGLLDGADDIPAFRDIGRAMSTALAEEACGGDERCVADALENPDASAICGSDGIPFKILVVKHLARRRWSELLDAASFEAMDTDGDGKLQTAEVAAALAAFTESLSAEQEAEAMVRSFDVDGDGAVTAEDVFELISHFDDEAELDLWRRVDARTFEAAAEAAQAQTRGKARRAKNHKNAVPNAKRGEEIQARYRPEDE
jgi:2',3'-cyclic-nucleotide 2'-phosphodiesterase (5'-nucleotidase family)